MTEQPILVAHRGYAAAWPENTLPALDAAVAAGARWVEVDVQLCADGVPVLLHDADLERVSGHAVSVFELTAAQLADHPVGEPGRFGTRFNAVRAPTLEQFAGWLAGHPGIQAFVELKAESIGRFGREAVLATCLQAMAPLHGRWVPISDDYRVLQLAAEAGAPHLGWVVREFDAAVAARARALPARWLFRNHLRLPDGPLAPGPWDWVCYEVGDVDTARALLARGVRWLETMDIATLHLALLQGDPSQP
ncbi:MAG: glycerophosphodiester phosphodiesterase family protein [Gammaproteobacteria bacterium]